MEVEDYDTDPFSSKNLWRLSSFTLQSLQPLEPLPWNDELPDLTGGLFQNPLKLFDNDESTLYHLNVFGDDDNFELDPIPETITDASSESQTGVNIGNGGDAAAESEEDIWSLDRLADLPGHKPRVRSWENYRDQSFREPVSAYFSESGAKGFDAALSHQASISGLEDSGRLARRDVFFRALFQLGLGWNSIFFRYNEQKRAFEKELKDVRISGISLPLLDSAIEPILQCGANMQRVRTFLRSNVKSKKLSAVSTFASATAVIVYTLEKHTSEQFRHAASFLQITALFQRCGELVGILANMVEAAEKSTSEAQIISSILRRVDHFSQMFPRMTKLLHELVTRVTVSWLNLVEVWIGLRAETTTMIEMATSGKFFAELERIQEPGKFKAGLERIEYRYCPDQIPSFIPADQAQQMFESGRSLRLLKRSHPQHPLSQYDVIRAACPPKLRCAITWTDIERIQNSAREYEAKLRAEILKYNRGETLRNKDDTDSDLDGSGEVETNETIANAFDVFDIEDGRYVTGLLANTSSVENDSLGKLVDKAERPNHQDLESYEDRLRPELTSALYLSLAPVISSQALLVDFSCLHLLFKEHKIRYHLALQWRFQLLGDGSFTSRLSHSLFDPEMESGERKAGVVRSSVHTGLRLGSRDTWPPASSELRLVLIGLLNDCYSENEGIGITDNVQLQREKELPGGLSFAIRELTAEEVVKVKDPNAIEALDFLRLQYKPPVVLEAIITSRSLNKYDRLFKHLLRLLRMVSVVKGLIRDSTTRGSLSGSTRNLFQKFRIDSQHFVLAVSDYCFHVGVGSNWQRFQETLSKIEHCLDRGDVDGTIEAAHSVPRLRAYHEDILDQILFALFLSKRHAQAAKVLEDIFGTILAFAPLSRLEGTSGVRHASESSVYQLYATFRKQAAAFVGYLRSLDGGKAASKSYVRSGAAFASKADPTSVFDHLLVRLDMKEYY